MNISTTAGRLIGQTMAMLLVSSRLECYLKQKMKTKSRTEQLTELTAGVVIQ